MSIEGEWILHYDWGCSGTYSEAGITFKNDGTFSTSEEDPLGGKWVQNDGMILFQYDQWDSIKTTYGPIYRSWWNSLGVQSMFQKT